ncbi:hypothetical protein [Halostagnicola bangensis]
MNSVSRFQLPTRSTEGLVAVLGITLTLVATILADSAGLSAMVLALGIGLTIAGTVCLAIDSAVIVRYSGAFVSLVAAQLLTFSGVVRLLGILGLLTVAGVAVFSRLE